MKRKIIWGLALVLLVLAGWALYGLGQRHGVAADARSPVGSATVANSEAAPASPDNGKKILYYHDPMVPGTKFDKPGQSPFMNMPLVPVYDDGGGTGNSSGITINPRAQQNLGIRTAAVVTGSLSPAIEAVGSVAWNERDIVVVAARANGYVEKLFARAVLDPVSKGQALAALYVPEWVAAQEEYLAVKKFRATDAPQGGLTSLMDGARQRMRLVGMSDAQIAQFEAQGKVEPRITLVSPIAGVVGELNVREGATVSSGAPLLRINGLSNVWIYAELPEALASRLSAGTEVEAKSPDGSVLKGKVGALLPEVNAQTRTLKVRIEVDNRAHRLLPGMFATLRFKQGVRDDMLLVPSEAIIATGTRTIVMLAEDGGRFTPTAVQPGIESNGQTEIKSGLKAGQRVVLSGQFLIDSEASLKGIETRQSAPPPSDATATKAPTQPSPPSAATERLVGSGKVQAVTAAEVTLAHGPIPALKWPAMTMRFSAPPGGTPKGITTGMDVDFELKQAQDGAYQIIDIRPRADATDQGKKP